MVLLSRIQGLIDQIEQQGLSSVDYEKEQALFALDLIQSGINHTKELEQLNNEALNGFI